MKIEWGGDRKRLDAELDELKSLGINMLRIMASSEGVGDEPFRMKPCLMTAPGVYNEEIFCGLDYFLDALSKRGFTAIGKDNNWHI
jgi:mannan endo-1,4-beta-mannosidase